MTIFVSPYDLSLFLCMHLNIFNINVDREISVYFVFLLSNFVMIFFNYLFLRLIKKKKKELAVCINVCICMYLNVCMDTCGYVDMHVHIYVYIYIYVCMYICV